MPPPAALTIAGSDSGGGAGIQADLKTFAAHGVWGTSAITAVTAQNTQGVHAVATLDPAMVEAQIDAVLRGFAPAAAKTGMLATAAIVEATVAALSRHGPPPLVVDPVMLAKDGTPLLDGAATLTLRERLFPLALLLTPNAPEAAALTGLPVTDRPEMEAAAALLLQTGPQAVLVKGGHIPGPEVHDLLVTQGGTLEWFTHDRVPGPPGHGTGCVLSAAITSNISQGKELSDSVALAGAFVRQAIHASQSCGLPTGPVTLLAIGGQL